MRKAASIFARQRVDSVAEPLSDKTVITLSDLAALNKRVISLDEGFGNIQKMQQRNEGAGDLASNPLVAEVLPKIRGAAAYARFASAQSETKLSAMCAKTALTLFHEDESHGTLQAPFVSYFVKHAALGHIQQHLAENEYNILQALDPKESANLNANTSVKTPLINMGRVNEMLHNIHKVTNQSLLEAEAKKKDGKPKLLDQLVNDPSYKKAVKGYVGEIIKTIDRELKNLNKQRGSAEACQSLMALSQEVARVQDQLAQYHIDINSIDNNVTAEARSLHIAGIF
ncbi:MAG: hypothetical protein M3R00_03505 [Pseudomonadota bacterium]|nr:hypothetical protein [Pseudomonadota bacterium]